MLGAWQGRGQHRVCRGQAQAGLAVEAADLGEETVDAVLISGEENHHALALALANSDPLRLAQLAVHDLVAIVPGLALPRVAHLIAHTVGETAP